MRSALEAQRMVAVNTFQAGEWTWRPPRGKPSRLDYVCILKSEYVPERSVWVSDDPDLILDQSVDHRVAVAECDARAVPNQEANAVVAEKASRIFPSRFDRRQLGDP
eukprot:8895871-Pyramimonas_sp.AAC.1